MTRFRFLSVGFCLVLGWMLAGSPVLEAQAVHPGSASTVIVLAAPAASGSMPAAAAPRSSANEEQGSGTEVDTTVYRHSATVRAVARMLHLDTEVVAEIFEYSNFAILAAFLLVVLFKYVPKMLRDRHRRIQQQLTEARLASERAKERLQAVERQFARLDEEIAEIRGQAEQDISNEEARMKALIEAERERILAAAEQEIRAAVAAARRDLKRFAGDLAVDRAERMISLTPEGDQALLRELEGSLRGQSRNGGSHE